MGYTMYFFKGKTAMSVKHFSHPKTFALVKSSIDKWVKHFNDKRKPTPIVVTYTEYAHYCKELGLPKGTESIELGVASNMILAEIRLPKENVKVEDLLHD